MPSTVDSLQISIEAKATKANDAIDRLVGKLDRLSISMGRMNTSNLNGLANGVDRLGRAMQTMNTVKTADFTRLATNLAKLGNINVSALNSTASSLSHLTRAFNNIGAVSQNATQVTDLAKGISKLGNKSVTNAIANIPQLAISLRNLMATLSKAPVVSQNVIQMTNALANLASQGSRVGTASRSIESGLNRASNSATKATASFRGLASVFGTFYANAFLLIRGLKGLYRSIESTADYIEAFNYFTVSFGKVASRWDSEWENYGDENARNYTNKFATTLNSTFTKLSGVSYDPQTGLLSETGLKNLGLNLQEVTQYAAQLGSMMDAVGQSGETTLATTDAFVRLAGDISSLYNIDYQEAADNMRSVLQGQSRAGYRFGWDTTMAALQATADRLDLSKAVSEMSQMEKQQLRILTILEQSRVAWGDQSNTINTLANQMRLFRNNIKEVAMLLGQLFVPILTKLMPIINGVTIAVKRLLSSIATFLGIKIEDVGQGFGGMEDGLEDVTDGFDSASAAAKKFKTITLGIDELNINEPQKDSGGSGGGASPLGGGIDLTDEILKATEEYEKVWQEAFDKMENTAQEWADSIADVFEPIVTPIKNLMKNLNLGNFFTAGRNVAEIATGLQEIILDAIRSVDWDGLGDNFGNFFGGLMTGLFRGMGNVSSIITELITGINSFLTSAITAIDWADFGYELMKGLQSFLDNLDILGISETITKLTTTINEAIVTAFGEMQEHPEEYSKLLGTLLLKALEAGVSILTSSTEIITNLLDNIFTTAFEVGSANGEKYGKEIGEWLGNVVSNGIESFKSGDLEKWFSDTFSDIVSKIKKHIEEAESFFAPLVEHIKGSFDRLPDWFKGVFSLSGENITESIQEKTSGISTWFDEKVVQPTIKFFEPIYTSVKRIFDGLWIVVKAIWIKASTWFNENVVSKITAVFNPIKDKLSSIFTSALNTVKNIWQNVSTWFTNHVTNPLKTAFETVTNKISALFKNIWSGIKKSLGSEMNATIAMIESAINKIVTGINGIIKGFNKVVSWASKVAEVDWDGVELIAKVTIPRIPTYQTGGFPDEYSLFMAGEYGHAEMLGTVGGKTAVAGGAEITGIRDAVYQSSQTEAELLREQNELLRQLLEKDTSVNIGDRDIARANARGSRSLGYALIT